MYTMLFNQSLMYSEGLGGYVFEFVTFLEAIIRHSYKSLIILHALLTLSDQFLAVIICGTELLDSYKIGIDFKLGRLRFF